MSDKRSLKQIISLGVLIFVLLVSSVFFVIKQFSKEKENMLIVISSERISNEDYGVKEVIEESINSNSINNNLY